MTARLTIVGLGPAGPDLITVGTRAALDRIRPQFLRTRRHPAASVLPDAHSFDEIYDAGESLETVYEQIVDRLVAEASAHGHVLYAVPGSPTVAERTVELLQSDARVSVDVLPGLSFADLAWTRLGVDPVARGVRIVDGHRFAVEAAGSRGPLLVAQCDDRYVLSDVKLAVDEPPEVPVTVLARLGLPDEEIRDVAWDDLDRAFAPDHLTSLYIPRLAAPIAGEVQRFAELVATLRRECPWDREQTHQSLTRHLLEETYEVLDAIGDLDDAEGDGYEHLAEELGDLLFQVLFHTTLAAEVGRFTLADVARGIHDKLVGRHPHVFGEVEADTADRVLQNWEQIKLQEKGRASVVDGIPRSLPALLYAHKILRKAETVGIEHRPAADAATSALEGDTDVGELLLSVVAFARRRGVDPETALRSAADRVRESVMRAEQTAQAAGSGAGDALRPGGSGAGAASTDA